MQHINRVKKDSGNKQISTDGVKDENELFEQVQEGKAIVNFRKTNNQVFYNPIQEFNRDLSISCMNTYSKLNDNKKLRILEALAASGIRSMRYALEIDNCSQIVANDFDRTAVQLIDKNIELNKVGDKVTSTCEDACVLMNSKAKNQFDCIDLDPYGSPSAFLDASIRSIKPGGLLLVTATDAGVLCGNGSDACYTKYGSPSLRTPACHELALRILLQCINAHAVRHSKYVEPLLSLSIDFYFRVFVRVGESQLKAKQSIDNIGSYLICTECHSFYELKYGKSVPTSGNCKFVFNTTSSAGFNLNRCDNCDGSLKLVGPVWTGKLHEKSFVNSVIDHVKSRNDCYKTRDRMMGMLSLASEELDNPMYYVLDDICSTMHLETPNHNVIRSALINAGYQVSYSHCHRNSVKTNAPVHVIWDILKKWSELKPIRDKWLKPEYRVFHILQKPVKTQVDFTIRQESLPESKKFKMVRYHEPPPFWGPKSKPKRKNEQDDCSNKEKINKISNDKDEKIDQ